jgi:hypothetical protein
VQARLSSGDTLSWEDNEDEENGQDSESFSGTGPDAVVPSEDGEFIQLCDQIPASGDVASGEDSNRKHGEGVHRPLFRGRSCRTKACEECFRPSGLQLHAASAASLSNVWENAKPIMALTQVPQNAHRPTQQ